jgi:hypothetical protein
MSFLWTTLEEIPTAEFEGKFCPYFIISLHSLSLSFSSKTHFLFNVSFDIHSMLFSHFIDLFKFGWLCLVKGL